MTSKTTIEVGNRIRRVTHFASPLAPQKRQQDTCLTQRKIVTWVSRCWGERRSGANQFGSLRFILFAFFGARLNQKSSVCLQFSEVGFRASCRLSWHRPFLMPSSPISQKIKRKKRLIPKGIFDFFLPLVISATSETAVGKTPYIYGIGRRVSNAIPRSGPSKGGQ